MFTWPSDDSNHHNAKEWSFWTANPSIFYPYLRSFGIHYLGLLCEPNKAHLWSDANHLLNFICHSAFSHKTWTPYISPMLLPSLMGSHMLAPLPRMFHICFAFLHKCLRAWRLIAFLFLFIHLFMSIKFSLPNWKPFQDGAVSYPVFLMSITVPNT